MLQASLDPAWILIGQTSWPSVYKGPDGYLNTLKGINVGINESIYEKLKCAREAIEGKMDG
jgi:hypothetical protein